MYFSGERLALLRLSSSPTDKSALFFRFLLVGDPVGVVVSGEEVGLCVVGVPVGAVVMGAALGDTVTGERDGLVVLGAPVTKVGERVTTVGLRDVGAKVPLSLRAEERNVPMASTALWHSALNVNRYCP